MDRQGADFFNVVKQVNTMLGSKPYGYANTIG